MYNEQEINNCVDTLKRELNIITESQEHRGLLLDAVEIIQQLQMEIAHCQVHIIHQQLPIVNKTSLESVVEELCFKLDTVLKYGNEYRNEMSKTKNEYLDFVNQTIAHDQNMSGQMFTLVSSFELTEEGNLIILKKNREKVSQILQKFQPNAPSNI